MLGLGGSGLEERAKAAGASLAEALSVLPPPNPVTRPQGSPLSAVGPQSAPQPTGSPMPPMGAVPPPPGLQSMSVPSAPTGPLKPQIAPLQQAALPTLGAIERPAASLMMRPPTQNPIMGGLAQVKSFAQGGFVEIH